MEPEDEILRVPKLSIDIGERSGQKGCHSKARPSSSIEYTADR